MNIEQEKKWLLDEKHGGIAGQAYTEDVQRLESGEPLAYIIGNISFLNCTIDLSKHPLIPRPETEFWTEKAIIEIKKQSAPRVLDLFSGSGCIGVAVAKNMPDAIVHFGEKDHKLLEQIKINCERNNIAANHYRVVETDIFSNIKDKYDFILANPPYIDRAANDVERSVLDHEPHKALYADDSGLSIIRSFLSEARDHLKPSGQILMEFGSDQQPAIESILTTLDYKDYSFHADQYDRPRYLSVSNT